MMPVSSSSRYANVPVFEAPTAAGDVHPTVAMRPGSAAGATVVYQHTVAAFETLEYLAWRAFHSSDAWWRIADANRLVFPLDWKPGDVVSLPVRRERGRVERTRKF
jgi:hypothetical protein